jgi:diacylglycerol kinase family enzyme
MHDAVIIFNSRSGENRGSDVDLSRRIAGRLRERGVEAGVIGFDNSGGRPVKWRRRLDEALDAGTRHVYAVGGDGTVLAVARALLDRDAVLGIVPTGTANLLARDLGIPLDPMPAVDALLESRPRRIDVGRVNGELFLCAWIRQPVAAGRVSVAALSITLSSSAARVSTPAFSNGQA